ncbi:MAG TPA: carboxypeptidase-like regulatory domain-containing protein [Verrucomicrobiae bacterium]|nr:carboxypeptidase-like regulatory domain-containing protein [Verrucomicrobiae bacterium]
MKTPISKSALAIVLVGILLIGGLVKLGLYRQGISTVTPPEAKAVPATTPAPAPAAAPVPEVTVAPVKPLDGPLPPVIPISLTNVVIDAENGTWLRDKDYLVAPHQPQTFGGVDFLMDGMIQLQGRLSKEWKNRSYRTTISVPLALTNISASGTEIIQRGSNISSLHLLGATRYGSNEQKPFVNLVWRYTDGTTQQTPVEYCTHFRDWVRNPYEEPANLPYPYSKVVWTAPQPSQPTHALRLYRTTFANPAPGKIIRQLEFVSAMEDPTLFIVGVTLDPLKPGQRPDTSSDLEPTDPVPPKKIEITVQSAAGEPLPQSKLSLQFDQEVNGKSVRTSGFLTTDGNGVATVNYPPADLSRLTISASHDDHGGRRMLWDLTAGDTVPATYTLKLGAAVNVGGVIVDESDAPIAGAKVVLNRFWRGPDGNPNQKGEQADFPSKTMTTDALGAWSAKGLPVDMLDRISVNVSHPDFLNTNITVGDNGAVEKELRAGTLKMVLHRGLDVRGLVTDINDYPVIGATVWAGLRNYGNRQEAKSDHSGKFLFHNIAEGETTFSVSAKGHQPDSRTVTVQKDMAEIVFKLPAGKTISAVVQDENSTAIPGVRVVLEGNGDVGRTYEFSATTDQYGRFTWDGAPDEPVQFYFGKEGYESKRNYKLAPDQENIVTLRHPRQLSGVVLDDSTSQPVTKFSLHTGTASSDDSTVYGSANEKSFSAADGKFTLSLSEEADNAVAVNADDYAQTIQHLPDAQDGTVSVTIRLKPSAGLSGVVLAPDGTPAPGVGVGVASELPRTSYQLSGGRLQSYSAQNKITVTDGDGHFKANVPSEDGTVVAAGDAGYASAPLAAVRSSGTVTLRAWGRIEGTLTIGGQPGTGKELLFNVTVPGLGTQFEGYKATTDDQGKFTMEKVPPGDGEIIRLVKTTPNSWNWSDRTPVTIKSGETTQVSLGDQGAVIAGRLRYDNPPTNGSTLNFEGSLSGTMPTTPQFNSPEESAAYYKSPEWTALMKLHKQYTLEIKPDGSFMADDVAPGQYTLNISARPGGSQPWMHQPIAQGSLPVTVPDSYSPTSPIGVGEVVLQPNQ